MADLYRVFRPRFARWVAWSVAAAVLVAGIALALALPAVAPGRVPTGDRVGIVVFSLLVVAFLGRQASVRAVPDKTGLTVRNLLLTRRVAWAEVVSVRFGQGRPWVQLDLADGGTLAVMGVQASDGARATVEAGRLATLVALHSVTDVDD
ncbi:PH domain-containing protein [Isoptericola sp. b441]|uniref:PH domain-containing protein n=1 Tax=Actinotalea lenta TaxID=3064654 RepID=A0ABT9DE39_9CELL|nr:MULTISPECIES: PH domain-containing protein [unclassified Isoptericola]MDO8107756.1 PH domain-containing protein [Isoptericola sp. b441]MDO8120573.1 PH domain-containing protein [Isoptericola sp. b490]